MGWCEGFEVGRAEALFLQLETKFSPLPVHIAARVKSASQEDLDLWAIRILSGTSPEQKFEGPGHSCQEALALTWGATSDLPIKPGLYWLGFSLGPPRRQEHISSRFDPWRARPPLAPTQYGPAGAHKCRPVRRLAAFTWTVREPKPSRMPVDRRQEAKARAR